MNAALKVPTVFTAIDNVSRVIDRMESKTKHFAANAEKVGQKAARVAVGGAAVAATVGLPLVLATKAAIDYEDSLASLSAITGVTGKDFEKFQSNIEATGDKMKVSYGNVAKSFELVGSAMPELLGNADALDRVSQATIILSRASREDLESSTRSLTGTMNQFSLGAEQADRVINVLAAGAKVGAATIAQTSDAMVNFGSVAASANMSVEQAVGSIQVLSKYGLFGAEAGTKLRGSLLKLQQAGLGYASGQFNINDALAEANTKMAKLSTAKKRDAFLQDKFGAENISTGRILLANTQLLKQYTAGVTGTSEATLQAAINQATAKQRFSEARAQLENLSVKIGSMLLPALNKLLEKIIPVIEKVVTWIKENPKLAKAIVIFVGILGGLAFVVSLVAGAIALATDAMIVFNIAAAANPVGLIVLAVVALIAAVALIITYWDEWGNALLMFVGGPIGWLISALASVYRNWEMIKAAFDKGAWAGIKALTNALLDGVLQPLQQILEVFAKLTGFEWAKNMATGLQKYREGMGLVTSKVTIDKYTPQLPSNITAYNPEVAPTQQSFSPLINPKVEQQQAMERTFNNNEQKQVSVKFENVPAGTTITGNGTDSINPNVTSTQSRK